MESYFFVWSLCHLTRWDFEKTFLIIVYLFYLYNNSNQDFATKHCLHFEEFYQALGFLSNLDVITIVIFH